VGILGFAESALRAGLTALFDGAFYILLGCFVAGLLHEFVNADRIRALMGGRGWRGILGATLIGAPLPLCSCAVLPTALSLRRKGASREATMAFLVSTPETGVDSVALTYGLLGPFMAIARPVAAVATAIVAAFTVRFWATEGDGPGIQAAHSVDARAESAHPHHEQVTPGIAEVPPETGASASAGTGGRVEDFKIRFVRAVRYGFTTLVDELAFWLILAFVLTGIVQALLPADFFTAYIGSGLTSILLMVVIGIPTYVCASASTPIAMAMMAKGLDPGAALVFMLTGPATNAATIGVVGRAFGRRFVLTYLGSVIGTAVVAGLIVNIIAQSTGLDFSVPSSVSTGSSSLLAALPGSVLLSILAWRVSEVGLGQGWRELREHLGSIAGLALSAGRSPGFRRVAPYTALTVGILALARSALFVVGPGEQGVVRTFGRPLMQPLEPGLHLVWPWPVSQKDVVAVTPIRSVAIGFLAPTEQANPAVARPRLTAPTSFPSHIGAFDSLRSPRIPDGSLFVTGDENVISVAAVIEYRIANAPNFLFGADRPEMLLRARGRAALVGELAHLPIDEIYGRSRAEIERVVLEALTAEQALQGAGVRPIAVRLLYVHAPDDVHRAFRDVASAAEDRTTSQSRALIDEEVIVRTAAAEAFATVADAEAASFERIERSKGDAASFTSLARALAGASSGTQTRLRLESFERVLTNRRKIIKPSVKQAPGLELWITPEGMVSGSSGGPYAPDTNSGSVRK